MLRPNNRTMTMKTNSLLVRALAATACLATSAVVFAQSTNAPLTLTVRADQSGAKINPAMWGIFFEDINLGADGGLYAELVKNRSFEFPESFCESTYVE